MTCRGGSEFPPPGELLSWIIQDNFFADHGSDQLEWFICVKCGDLPQGLIPGMIGQGKFGIVDWKHLFCPELFCGLQNLVGLGMDLFPVTVVLAIFEYGEVEWSELLTNFCEMSIITTVTAKKDPEPGTQQDKGGPQHLIPFKASSGEMPGGGCMNPGSILQRKLFIPVHLNDDVRIITQYSRCSPDPSPKMTFLMQGRRSLMVL